MSVREPAAVRMSLESLTGLPTAHRSIAEKPFFAYQSLVRRAVDVFGDEIKASLWLSTPSADLEGRVPLEVASDMGEEELITKLFEPIFVRIEHGIYS